MELLVIVSILLIAISYFYVASGEYEKSKIRELEIKKNIEICKFLEKEGILLLNKKYPLINFEYVYNYDDLDLNIATVYENIYNQFLNKNFIPNEQMLITWDNEVEYRITSYGKMPKDWQKRRYEVLVRDGFSCKRCGLKIDEKVAHIHHVHRRSDGGTHITSNLISLCRDCHTIQDGHEIMHTINTYFISYNSRKKIHLWNCKNKGYCKKIKTTLPKLISKGYTPCKICNPEKEHLKKKNDFNLSIYKEIKNLYNLYNIES